MPGAGAITFEVSYSLKNNTYLGINQFSIPFSSPTFESYSPLQTVRDLVESINAVAGSKIVKTFGWWDADKQTMVGWTNVDTTPVPQNGAPQTLQESYLVRDKVYQSSVSQNINFKISGVR